MNKTKIDWADMTWNPVTGCLHECEYCYARKIANRFGKFDGSFCLVPHKEKNVGTLGNPLFELNEKRYLHKNNAKPQWLPYPFGFKPTFHRYRLDEPQHKIKPQNIFVCSMADIFGDWVPDEWISEVFKACEAAPQHRYLFLTKNPKRYLDLYNKKAFPYKDNYWFGTTITKPLDEFVWAKDTPYKTFISIEPILEPLKLETGHFPDWVIIGAETGNRKDKVTPKKEWIDSIAEQCKSADTPLFMKESLRELMGEDFIQEFPWEVKS